MKNKTIKFILFILFIIGFCFFSNNFIQVSYYNCSYKGNKDYKIVQVSDLHNKTFGNYLLNKIKKQNPNIIVVTGDIISSNDTNYENVYNFLNNCSKIANTYYISGNHETCNNKKYKDLLSYLKNLNITFLDNNSIHLDENINLIGLKDINGVGYNNFKTSLHKLKDENKFNLLLSHRPELFDLYQEENIDLVLTGHAHGGQWRIPFTNKGIYAPSQGFFPTLIEGIHTKNNTTMIISRGLGNSSFPLRLFNQPELVVINLKGE